MVLYRCVVMEFVKRGTLDLRLVCRSNRVSNPLGDGVQEPLLQSLDHTQARLQYGHCHNQALFLGLSELSS